MVSIVLSNPFANQRKIKLVLDPLSESYDFQQSQFLSDPEILPKMLEMINSASEEILLISPWIYKDIIHESLTIARNRGVESENKNKSKHSLHLVYS